MVKLEIIWYQFSGEDDFIVDDENQPIREKSRKKGGKVQDRYCVGFDFI